MVKNIAASVKARLLNQARSKGDDFNQLLDRYTRERFLYRLSQSLKALQNKDVKLSIIYCFGDREV